MKLTAKQMLEFIVKNKPEEYKSYIEPIFAQSYASALSDITGVFFEYSRYEVKSSHFENFEADMELPPQENARLYKKFIEAKGMNYDEYINFSHHKPLFVNNSLRQDSPNKFHAHGYSNAVLICFLLDLCGMKTNFEDRTEENNFMDKNKIQYRQLMESVWIGNLHVKCYLNGRIDIKCLTAEQQAKIDHWFKIAKLFI